MDFDKLLAEAKGEYVGPSRGEVALAFGVALGGLAGLGLVLYEVLK
jgi:hypothetical protein